MDVPEFQLQHICSKVSLDVLDVARWRSILPPHNRIWMHVFRADASYACSQLSWERTAFALDESL